MHVLAQFCDKRTVRIKREKLLFLENIQDVDEITTSADGLALVNVPPFQSSLLMYHIYCLNTTVPCQISMYHLV
jgi:hypothetical protein